MNAPTRRSDVIVALGVGRMRRGIATAFAYAGYPVWLVDIKSRATDAVEALRTQVLGEIDASLRAMSQWGTFDDALAAQLADFVTHPHRFPNARRPNPAHVVPLVELSAHEGTSRHSGESGSVVSSRRS